MLLALVAIDATFHVDHPLRAMAALGWPFAICAFIFILRLRGEHRSRLDDAAHLLIFWLASALLCWEFAWQCSRLMPAVALWRDALWLLIPGASILWLLRKQRVGSWPVATREALYLRRFAVDAGRLPGTRASAA